ncbi:MAG: SRPBCC domain-containing protein [Pirellulales bacterium]
MPAGNYEFGGEERFRSSPEQVYAVVTNVDGLARNIPDLATSKRVDDRTLECTVRPGFGFLRGTLKLVIQLANLVPPESATMSIDARGIGQSLRVTSQLAVSPADDGGSRLAWTATVTDLKGLVATISPALIRAAADQVIRNSWEGLRQELGEAEA